MSKMRIGYGYDIHRLEEGRPFVLGGIEIPFHKGPAGHSDADVLLHAVIDALLGACALGDIGQHFPDTDEEFKDIDSRVLLQKTVKLVKDRNFHIVNIDSTVIAEQPRLASHILRMRKRLAEDLDIELDRVSVKATTSEETGPEGEGRAISARAVALLSGVADG